MIPNELANSKFHRSLIGVVFPNCITALKWETTKVFAAFCEPNNIQNFLLGIIKYLGLQVIPVEFPISLSEILRLETVRAQDVVCLNSNCIKGGCIKNIIVVRRMVSSSGKLEFGLYTQHYCSYCLSNSLFFDFFERPIYV